MSIAADEIALELARAEADVAAAQRRVTYWRDLPSPGQPLAPGVPGDVRMFGGEGVKPPTAADHPPSTAPGG